MAENNNVQNTNKSYKAVPNLECLQYHGTPEKPDIKIFVSHRIDLDSETIDNPLYVPVRCGAVYDKRADVKLLGDDTGVNISKKRFSYNELTVQYWAWKNVKADYYGLCHYRRYISFDDKKYPTGFDEHSNGCVVEDYLDNEAISKHCLNENTMTQLIKQYDVIAIDPIKLSGISNYSAMERAPDWHNIKDADVMMDVVKRLYPEMRDAVEYYMLHSPNSWLYNCWIMKKDVFEKYSEWLFTVLAEIEKEVDISHYSSKKYRVFGVLGERLFGIYLTYLITKTATKIKCRQLIFFKNTEKEENLFPAYSLNNIAITSNFSNSYVPVFSVLLQSIIDNASYDNNYDIIVLSQDITDENKQTLMEMCKSFTNFSVRFINSARYLPPVKRLVNNGVLPSDVFVRVLIPQILQNYSRVLVLDADMICCTDVAELFNLNLKGNVAGAVRDTVWQGYLNGMIPDVLEYAKDVLVLKDPYNYCNTGVLLFDCERYRDAYSLKFLQNHIATHNYRICDQDELNSLLDQRIEFIGNEWNTFTYSNSFIQSCVDHAPFQDREKYMKARQNPKIIHFAAHPKPWRVSTSDFAIDFWPVARRSPYYEALLQMLIKYNAEVVLDEKGFSLVPNQCSQSHARDIVDKWLPIGSRRRNALKKIMPMGSPLYNFCKKTYYRLIAK